MDYAKSTAREQAAAAQESCLRHSRGSRIAFFVIFLASASFVKNVMIFILGALRSMKALRSSCVFIFSWRTVLELTAAAFFFINLRKQETIQDSVQDSVQECTESTHERFLRNNGSTYADVKDIKGKAQFLQFLFLNLTRLNFDELIYKKMLI